MTDSSDRAMMVRPQSRGITFEQQKQLAQYAAQSRKFANIKSPQAAMIIMQFGREMGLGPATSLQAIYEQNGIPSLKGNTIAARIKSMPWRDTTLTKYDYRVPNLNNNQCTLAFFERNDDGVMEKRGDFTFTLDDAKRAGFLEGRNAHSYKKFPRQMLFNRAMTSGARIYCPDCLGGNAAYTPGELGMEVGDPETDAPARPTVEVVDVEFTEVAGEAEGISEEEYAALTAAANAKNLCLGDVVGGLGGDPNDLRGITRSQYAAALTFIEQK